MKAVDLRKLTDDELRARVSETRDRLFDLKLKHATGQLEGTSSLRAARRDLARALTVQSDRRRSA
jgi:large subunit ribosomal protein L29